MYKSWWRLQSLFDGSLTNQIITTASLKYCRTGKPNILKSVNTENKYLFGRLLETQRQRRTTIRRQTQIESIGETATEDNDPDKKSDSKNVLHGPTANNNYTSNKKKRPSNLSSEVSNHEASQEVPFSGFTHVETVKSKRSSHNVNDNEINIKNLQVDVNRSNLEHNTPAKKVTKRKIKAESQVPNLSSPLGKPEDNKAMTEPRKSSLSTFTISSNHLQINEKNFPLKNKEKPSVIDTLKLCPASFGFKDPEVKSYATFPSVSKIIEDTMSSKKRLILNKWKESMIKELGEDGFNKHNLAVKERGARFHSAIRETMLGRATNHDDGEIRDAIRSLNWLMEHVSSPLAVESITGHPELRYRGIPDCVAMFRDVPVVVDWKLSDKPKKDLKDTYDAPVQITAYMGALNHDPNYTWAVNHGLVAVAYTSGEPADVFLLSPEHCRVYWRHWLLRVERFNSRSHLHIEHDIDESELSLD